MAREVHIDGGNLMYRVVHEQVTGGYTPKKTVVFYGPYRWLWWATLVAHWVCGDWDRVLVQEQKMPSADGPR